MGELRLEDWFVPVLYQEEHDPQLFDTRQSTETQRLRRRHRERSLGALPAPPPHSFVGRSRALLALERLLHDQPYALIVGAGGVEGFGDGAIDRVACLGPVECDDRDAFASLVGDDLGHGERSYADLVDGGEPA